MKKGEVAKVAKLVGQCARDVLAVEVDSGDYRVARQVGRRRAKDPVVVADIGSDPCPGYVVWVMGYQLLPCLERHDRC